MIRDDGGGKLLIAEGQTTGPAMGHLIGDAVALAPRRSVPEHEAAVFRTDRARKATGEIAGIIQRD